MAQPGDDAVAAVTRTYRVFARREVRGRSPAYEALAESVADDAALVSFIAALPAEKRQPNLLFAAARYLLGVAPGIRSLRELVSQSRAELTQVILTRRTQTNDPARCAILLPALAQLPEPLALIEAGASAGLTLLFDRYSYDYAGHRLAGRDPDAPTLRCEPRGPVPLPARIPAIIWRAGLDLNPLLEVAGERFPALLIRTSMRPKRSTAACAAAWASSMLVTSSLVASRLSCGPPSVFSTSSGRRPVATTRWPAARASRAMSAPRALVE